MTYEHGNYELYTSKMHLKSGKDQIIYFFTKKGNTPKSGVKCDKPDGYNVGVNSRTGLPYLTKK